MAISPAQYDFTLQRRADYPLPLRIRLGGAPIPLIGWTAAASVYNKARTTKYADWVITYPDRADGRIDLFLSKEQTVWFPDVVYSDLRLTDPYGVEEYYAEFVITVSEGYTA